MRGTLDHSVFAFGGRARPYAACAFPSREQYSTARISISQWMEIDDARAYRFGCHYHGRGKCYHGGCEGLP
jgi:hypothetical protein